MKDLEYLKKRKKYSVIPEVPTHRIDNTNIEPDLVAAMIDSFWVEQKANRLKKFAKDFA